MIGYPHTLRQLRDGIEQNVPGWLNRARTRTAQCEVAVMHVGAPFWSEVKDYFRTLQGAHKCAFCERKLPTGQAGAYEHDVEHFRPKGRVNPWPAPASLANINFTAPPNPNAGYYLLAYHPLNYSVACKSCNEGLKKDYYPIEGAYVLDAKSPPPVSAEKPLLIYPLAATGEKPEDLIVFDGASPMPAKSRGYANRRARVTIAFFKLGDAAEREDLMVERCHLIITLKPLLETVSGNASHVEKAEAQELIEAYTSDRARHANCARCFVKLFRSDQASALVVFQNARRLVIASS